MRVGRVELTTLCFNCLPVTFTACIVDRWYCLTELPCISTPESCLETAANQHHLHCQTGKRRRQHQVHPFPSTMCSISHWRMALRCEQCWASTRLIHTRSICGDHSHQHHFQSALLLANNTLQHTACWQPLSYQQPGFARTSAVASWVVACSRTLPYISKGNQQSATDPPTPQCHPVPPDTCVCIQAACTAAEPLQTRPPQHPVHCRPVPLQRPCAVLCSVTPCFALCPCHTPYDMCVRMCAPRSL